MNNLPTFTRADNALWRRLLIITFNTKFVKNTKNKNEKRINENLIEGIENNNNPYNQFINLLLNYYTSKNIVIFKYQIVVFLPHVFLF